MPTRHHISRKGRRAAVAKERVKAAAKRRKNKAKRLAKLEKQK